MKKALALVLSLLVAFSMFSVVSFATEADVEEIEPGTQISEGYVKIEFVKDGLVVRTLKAKLGVSIPADLVPEVEKEYYLETEDGKEYKYTFTGWTSNVDGKPYYAGTIPAAAANVQYTATYMEEDYSERQSFWQFVESIFERINLLFEYFATIFNF